MLDIKWKKSERSLYGYILAYVFFLACIVTVALSVNSMIQYHDLKMMKDINATGFDYAQCGIEPGDTSGMLTNCWTHFYSILANLKHCLAWLLSRVLSLLNQNTVANRFSEDRLSGNINFVKLKKW